MFAVSYSSTGRQLFSCADKLGLGTASWKLFGKTARSAVLTLASSSVFRVSYWRFFLFYSCCRFHNFLHDQKRLVRRKKAWNSWVSACFTHRHLPSRVCVRLFGPFVSVTVHSSPCLFKLIPQLPTFKTRACFDVVRGAVHSAIRFTVSLLLLRFCVF